jgi:hypothetical protein
MREDRPHEQYPTGAAMQPAGRKFSQGDAGETAMPGGIFPFHALRLRAATPMVT